jgi:hypothetical protein
MLYRRSKVQPHTPIAIAMSQPFDIANVVPEDEPLGEREDDIYDDIREDISIVSEETRTLDDWVTSSDGNPIKMLGVQAIRLYKHLSDAESNPTTADNTTVRLYRCFLAAVQRNIEKGGRIAQQDVLSVSGGAILRAEGISNLHQKMTRHMVRLRNGEKVQSVSIRDIPSVPARSSIARRSHIYKPSSPLYWDWFNSSTQSCVS